MFKTVFEIRVTVLLKTFLMDLMYEVCVFSSDGCTSSSCDRERAFSSVSDFTADIFRACCELEKVSYLNGCLRFIQYSCRKVNMQKNNEVFTQPGYQKHCVLVK